MSEFWRNKTVLITGAGGFTGRHLVEKLHQYGAHVRAFIRYNSRNDYEQDILDFEFMRDQFLKGAQ